MLLGLADGRGALCLGERCRDAGITDVKILLGSGAKISGTRPTPVQRFLIGALFGYGTEAFVFFCLKNKITGARRLKAHRIRKKK